MDLIKLSCVNCGGTLEIDSQVQLATCAYCGAQLQVKRSESACWSELQGVLDRQLASIELLHLKQDLAACDAAWERRRQKFLTKGQEPIAVQPEPLWIMSAVLGVLGGLLILIAVFSGANSHPGNNRVTYPFVYQNSSGVRPRTPDDQMKFALSMGCCGATSLLVAGASLVGYLGMREKHLAFREARSRHRAQRDEILEQIADCQQRQTEQGVT